MTYYGEHCPDCGERLDAFGYCPNTPLIDSIRGLRFCGGDQPHPESCSCVACKSRRAHTAKILEGLE